MKMKRHLLKGGGCFDVDAPKFNAIPSPASQRIDFTTNPITNPESVAILTTHYNPQRFKRLRETYYEWLPSLGSLADRLTCVELVMDDDEPEIDDSLIIRGTREKHTLWQKEAMLNIAIRQLPPSVRYVAWVDHDIVNHDPNWLADSIAMIDDGAIAVQLFSRMLFLDRDRTVASEKIGSVKHGTGCPGGSWIADRSYIDSIGGLWDRNIVGGGDVAFYCGVANKTQSWQAYIERHQGNYVQQFKEWVEQATKKRRGRVATSLNATASHLYHGRRENRQYVSREKIMNRHGFDPSKHVCLNSDGLLEWTDSASDSFRREVAEYFADRKEDD
jgi:hypothetical protein